MYQPLYPAREQKINIRGIDYQLLHWGNPQGEPLWLLHGWMDCAASFQFMLDASAPELRQYHLIAPDWRGFGGSGWAQEQYYAPDYLADLEALLDAICPGQPVNLLGHSMGGMVACLYAGIRPQRVKQLISLEGFGLPRSQASQAPDRYARWLDEQTYPAKAGKKMDYHMVSGRIRQHHPRLAPDKAIWLAHQLACEGTEGLRYCADPRHRWVNPVLYRLEEAMACWQRVSAKTLWLAGDEIALLRWLGEDALEFAKRKACFADLRYQCLEGSGHNLHYDVPEALAHAVLAFLSQGKG